MMKGRKNRSKGEQYNLQNLPQHAMRLIYPRKTSEKDQKGVKKRAVVKHSPPADRLPIAFQEAPSCLAIK